MSDEAIPEAAETPLADMVADLVQELETVWRFRLQLPASFASHSCGRELSREVGRILRASSIRSSS